MPKIRDTNKPQHHASEFHYGSITIDMLPEGTAPLQIPFWDGVQWHLVNLKTIGGIEINFDAANNNLEFYAAGSRFHTTFIADTVILAPMERSFTADAVLA